MDFHLDNSLQKGDGFLIHFFVVMFLSNINNYKFRLYTCDTLMYLS